jgi:predicted nuclease of predicted toxin-antitoxin system
MKILLDENIDIRFKKFFPVHIEVHTVKDMNWTGIKNGELIQLLAQNNFDCWIVVDKNIPYQQNVENIPFTIIVLDVLKNTLKNIQALMPKIMNALDNPFSGKVIVIGEV